MINLEKVLNASKMSHRLQWNNIVLNSSRSFDFVIVVIKFVLLYVNSCLCVFINFYLQVVPLPPVSLA